MTLAKHILTTTDFSPSSEEGIRRVAELASEASGVKVSVIHVFDPTPLAPIATRGFELSEQLVDEQELEKAIGRALMEVRNGPLADIEEVHTEVVEAANAADGIVRYAKEHDVDLIVLSTHGRTGLAHLLIGSVAENVVRHAECAVVTVPAGPRKKS